MNQLRTYTHELGNVRILEIEGEPWFVGKDVAEILGYKKTRNAIATHVDEEDKDALKQGTHGGEQEMTIINESGLYSLKEEINERIKIHCRCGFYRTLYVHGKSI